MGEVYLGQTTFGGLGDLLARTINVPPASATASVATPAVHSGDRFVAPVGSAAASAPVPLPRIVIFAPAASASAALGAVVHGGRFRADMPTTLALYGRATELELERATTLEVDRATLLELWRLTHTLALYGRATTLVVGEPTSLDLNARTTTLYLDPGDTTLVPDDNVKELVLDG